MRGKRGKMGKRLSRGKKGEVQRRRNKERGKKKKRTSAALKSADRQKDVRKADAVAISGCRLWLFRVIAVVVIPALFLVLVEVALRIAGYGFPAAAIINCEVDGKDGYCDNIKFSWRFFPRNIAREFDPFIFPADKPDDSYRIFVLGASAAQGVPDGAFCFGRFLKVMLDEEYPEVNFEVINTAMPAINSHVVLEIAKDCVRHKPDLFIVYLGNNEVVGPYGAGTVFAPLSDNLFLIRAGIGLKGTRLGQALNDLVGAIGKRDTPEVWGGLEMFLEKQIRANDSDLQTVYGHFRSNLEDIVRVGRRGGAKVVVCTVGSNLKDCPPFASLHRLDLTETEKKKWDDIYRAGTGYEAVGKYTEAIGHYLKAVEIDDSFAALQFRLGRCYWAMGEYDKSMERYVRARELDTLRIRADSRVNHIIRDVAGGKEAEGVYLVDAVKAFERNSPPGEELFYEHVHLNFKGNYLLAKTVFEQVEKVLAGRTKADGGRLLSEAQCAERLAYTGWDQYKIAAGVLTGYVEKPPFTNQLYHKEHVRRMKQKLSALEIYLTPEALKQTKIQYRQAVRKSPLDPWLREKYAQLLMEDLKDNREVVEQCRLLIEHLPHYYQAHLTLGVLLGKQGNLGEAIEHILEAIRIMPFCADAHYNLGYVYQLHGWSNKAIEHYYKTVRLKPDYMAAWLNLGVLLDRQGELDEAVETYRKGLLYVPDDAVLRCNLAILLNAQGHRDEAIKELQSALEIDPNYTKARSELTVLLQKRD